MKFLGQLPACLYDRRHLSCMKETSWSGSFGWTGCSWVVWASTASTARAAPSRDQGCLTHPRPNKHSSLYSTPWFLRFLLCCTYVLLCKFIAHFQEYYMAYVSIIHVFVSAWLDEAGFVHLRSDAFVRACVEQWPQIWWRAPTRSSWRSRAQSGCCSTSPPGSSPVVKVATSLSLPFRPIPFA